MLAFNLGLPEMIVIGIVAVLVFGKRLPEVGRNLGQSFVEFKRGLRGGEAEAKDSNKEAKSGDDKKA